MQIFFKYSFEYFSYYSITPPPPSLHSNFQLIINGKRRKAWINFLSQRKICRFLMHLFTLIMAELCNYSLSRQRTTNFYLQKTWSHLWILQFALVAYDIRCLLILELHSVKLAQSDSGLFSANCFWPALALLAEFWLIDQGNLWR